MSHGRAELVEIASTDERYAFEAYEFLCHALAYTQEMMERPAAVDPESGDAVIHHVTGRELLEGVRLFGLEQFGMMAGVVFKLWGIQSTSDFGAMVYRLIDAGLWHKSATDRLEDFDNVYNFEQVFVREYKLQWEEI